MYKRRINEFNGDFLMSREDFEGQREYSKKLHTKRVSDIANRIEYAKKQFEKYDIEYILKNAQTGHFHVRRKSDDKLFQFYAGTGKIQGYSQRGVHKLIRMVNDERFN